MSRIRFDSFKFDPGTGLLVHGDGSESTLRPKAARALHYLLTRAPAIVTRDELIAAVWPDGRVRDFDAGLSAILHELRQALGDDAAEARWLETVPRRGYRIKVPVKTDRRGRPFWTWIVAPVAVLALVVGIAGWWWQSRMPVTWTGQVAVAPVVVYSTPGSEGDGASGEPSWLLTDTLIALLWRHRPEGIEVIGRSSLDRGDSAREIARALGERLGVRWILHGWARPRGDRWRFTLSLYEMPDAELRWSEQFDSEAEPDARPEELMERAVKALVAAGSTGF